jgi:hypothetical protein
MTWTWPDPISFVADIVTFVGIPLLYVSTRQMYHEFEKEREPQAVSHGCLEFYDVVGKCGINLVPLSEVTAIPRSGDRVLLPGEYVDRKNYGGGVYEVLSVEFAYLPASDEVDQPCPALPSKICVAVRQITK